MAEELDQIAEMVLDDRKVSINMIDGMFVVSAIPNDFEGGPLPDEWTAEDQHLDEAISKVFTTHNLIEDE